MICQETITAVATAPGEGAVGIVRVSGPAAPTLFQQFFRSRNLQPVQQPKPRHLYFGLFLDESGHPLDQVLAVHMPGPHSFTGEDVVEFHCHGGSTIISRILELCSTRCRLAQPGEFSRRAFLNGKLDLTQAEAIIDVIRAKTPEAARIASDVMQGRLRDTLQELRGELIAIQGNLEATMEFSDEDIAPASTTALAQRLTGVRQQLENLLAHSRTGMLMRDGAAVAIVGKPNVGKSSLLNALSRSERSIVTAIPGTTRDIVEQYISVHGLPIRLLDTAGIRQSQDAVEQIGIERTRSAIQQADIILWLLDTSRPADEEDHEIARLVQGKPCLVLLNKSDLPRAMDESILHAMDHDTILTTSLQTGDGLEKLMDTLFRKLSGAHHESHSNPLLSRARQRESMANALESLGHAQDTLIRGLGYELVSMDIQHAFSYLGEILGEVVTDDILDTIFSEFCIGK